MCRHITLLPVITSFFCMCDWFTKFSWVYFPSSTNSTVLPETWWNQSGNRTLVPTRVTFISYVFSRPKTGGRVKSGNSTRSRWYVNSTMIVSIDAVSVVSVYPFVDKFAVMSIRRLFLDTNPPTIRNNLRGKTPFQCSSQWQVEGRKDGAVSRDAWPVGREQLVRSFVRGSK